MDWIRMDNAKTTYITNTLSRDNILSLSISIHRALTRILKTGVQDSHLAKSRSPTGTSGSPTLKKLTDRQIDR